MNYQLALDQSTSASKALIYDRNGVVVDEASVAHQQIYPKPGWVEHDPEEIWQNVKSAVKQLVDRNPGLLNSIDFVSITNQRETILLIDRNTGKPVMNAMVWMCTRSDSICKNIRSTEAGDMIKERTGLEIDPYFSATKLKWAFDNDPILKQRVHAGEVLISTIDSYLVHRMTRGAVFATDHTNASRTMLYNLGETRWDPDVCKFFDIPIEALPQIYDCNALYGPTTFDDILPAPLPIFGVMGDSQAALFAQRCYEVGSSKVTLGTGSSLLYNIGEKPIRSKNGNVTTLASVISEKATYSFEGVIRFSSGTMDWLKNQLGLYDDILKAEELASSVEDNGGVYLVPAFTGLGAPYWKSDAKAAIVGLTTQADRRHILRAGFESMAYQVKDVLELLKVESGQPCKLLNIDGGPSRSPFLMQMLADILQMEIHVSLTQNCSAFGAMLAGMLGCGIFKSVEELDQIPAPHQTYQPKADPATIASQYEGWKQAVSRVAG